MEAAKGTEGLKNQAIGDQGELLVQAMLRSWGWRPTKISSDWGTDLYVETAMSPIEAAPAFVVQVKTSGIRSKRAAQTARLKQRAATHLQQHPLPAFVFVVDLGSRKLGWIYVSEMLDKHSPESTSRSSVTLPIPPEQTLLIASSAAPASLVDQIRRGTLYVAARVQGSLLQHVTLREKFLNSLDDRYKVDVSVVGHAERLGINPVSQGIETSFRLRLSPSDSTAHQMKEFFDWAVPVEADGATIQLGDSPLFRHLLPENASGFVRFDPDPVWDGNARVGPIFEYENERTVAGQLMLPMRVFAGEQGLRIVLHDEWVGFKLELRAGKESSSVKAEIQLSPQIQKAPVGDLSRLRGYTRFLLAIKTGERFGIHPIGGKDLIEGRRISESNLEEFLELAAVIEALEALSYLSPSPLLDEVQPDLERVTWEELGRWVVLSQLARGQEVAMDVTSYRLEFDFDVGDERLHGLRTEPRVFEYSYIVRIGKYFVWCPIRLAMNGFSLEDVQPKEKLKAILLRPATEEASIRIRRSGPLHREEVNRSSDEKNSRPSPRG